MGPTEPVAAAVLPRWRVVVAALALVVGLIAVAIVASVVAKRAGGEPAKSMVNALICLAGMALVMRLVAVGWLKLEPRTLGVELSPAAWRRWPLGVVLGVAAAALGFGLAVLFGGLQVEGFVAPAAGLVVGGALATAIHAAFEELAFRAGLVGVVRQRFPTAVAVAIPAVVFGVLHLNNAGASALGALNAGLAGAALGVWYLDGGRPSIALVSGVHFAWNEALYLLGIPVSGTTNDVAFLSVKSSSALWSGGAFGLEASPATTVAFGALLFVGLWRLRSSK